MFCRGLEERRHRLPTALKAKLSNPSPATYSRVWTTFCKDHRFRRFHPTALLRILAEGVAEGAWDSAAPARSVVTTAGRYLSRRGAIPPTPDRLRRFLQTLRGRLHRQSRLERQAFLARAAGTAMSRRALPRRVVVVRELLRFPPAAHGKPNLDRLVAESTCRREVQETLRSMGLSQERLLDHPACEELYDFFERRANSTLDRWEEKQVLHAHRFYLAFRGQQALDNCLYIFARRCSSIRKRSKKQAKESIAEASQALFERGDLKFQPLYRALLGSTRAGPPKRFHRFRPLARTLAEHEKEVRSRRGFYRILARKAVVARQMVPHLRGVAFEGKDAHARTVVAILPEVLEVQPFRTPVPAHLRWRLRFLPVPDELMTERRVFDTIVLLTLADMLWARRVVCPASRQFRDEWKPMRDVSPSSPAPLVEALATIRREIGQTWTELAQAPRGLAIEGGRLIGRRPSRKWEKAQERANERARQRFLSGVPDVTPARVLRDVHGWTDFLEAFAPKHPEARRLPKLERETQAIACILARAMDVGVRAMSGLFSKRMTVGKLKNFDEVHLTAPALRVALRQLLEAWERERLGLPWGDGKGSAADGKSVISSEKTLQSGFHPRHKKVGMTVYWMIRNDGIAVQMGLISPREWESWYLLSSILEPFGGTSPEWAAGDTHGQHLALWALSLLMGKRIMARFRGLGKVKLYYDGSAEGLPVEGVGQIDWRKIERALPSLARLVKALQEGKVHARDVLRAWNIYDEEGRNVSEALRELGKAVRTIYVLRYALSPDLRRQVRESCNRVERWNFFETDVNWGHAGRMQTRDPRRQEVNVLCRVLLMNSIVFWTAKRYGSKLRKIPAATPVMWDHVALMGKQGFT
ncbi:MAG: Tn3 family transposase [Euryarchaeota archaeon]|nr:Tn3 family transposase [Euryarchaeota archaeon]MDE1836017.1 Tn3 family transposase [Euryarchaeota archaeon]MDE1882050.1 Tn3 family transposase [Euryarchaeota archaeon]MDE2046397.1 Tn3 family transposase [Thermoplasmata archaeon]